MTDSQLADSLCLYEKQQVATRKLVKILLPPQWNWLAQVEFQSRVAVGYPDSFGVLNPVARKKLQLSKEQLEQIEGLIESYHRNRDEQLRIAAEPLEKVQLDPIDEDAGRSILTPKQQAIYRKCFGDD